MRYKMQASLSMLSHFVFDGHPSQSSTTFGIALTRWANSLFKLSKGLCWSDVDIASISSPVTLNTKKKGKWSLKKEMRYAPTYFYWTKANNKW
jgi:hypothetical protein